jgi:hypothetical protein
MSDIQAKIAELEAEMVRTECCDCRRQFTVTSIVV